MCYLGSVARNERLLSTTFFFLKDIDVGLEFLVDVQSTRLADDLTYTNISYNSFYFKNYL